MEEIKTTETIRSLLKERITKLNNDDSLTTEEKKAEFKKFYLSTVENSQKIGLMEKITKWWNKTSQESRAGKITKTVISAGLIGTGVFLGGDMTGINKNASLVSKLISRTFLAGLSSSILTASITQKGLKKAKDKFDNLSNAQKRVASVATILLGGAGVGAFVYFAGLTTAGITTLSIIGKLSTNKYLYGSRIKKTEEKIKVLEKEEEETIKVLEKEEDSLNINKLANKLLEIETEIAKLNKKLNKINTYKSLTNGAFSLASGLGSMAAHHLEINDTVRKAISNLKSVFGVDVHEAPGIQQTAAPHLEKNDTVNDTVRKAISNPKSVFDVGVHEAPKIQHGFQHEVKFVLGQGGVPKNLETTFHAIAADHMTLGDEGVNEEFGAKSLNMAANLVKLSEGHNVAGFSHDNFEKVAYFDTKTGELEIKDPQEFNKLVDELENHANKLWEKGVLQRGAVRELGEISKHRWLDIIHADGLDKGSIGNAEGIPGHDTITTEDITDFGPSKIVQEARYYNNPDVINGNEGEFLLTEQLDPTTGKPYEGAGNTGLNENTDTSMTSKSMENVWEQSKNMNLKEFLERNDLRTSEQNKLAELLRKEYDEAVKKDPNVTNLIERKSRLTLEGARAIYDEVLNKGIDIKPGPDDITSTNLDGDKIYTKEFQTLREDAFDFGYDFSDEQLSEIQDNYQDTLTKIFPEQEHWLDMEDKSAYKFIRMDENKISDPEKLRLHNLLKNITEKTKLEPKGGFLRKDEPINKFLMRNFLEAKAQSIELNPIETTTNLDNPNIDAVSDFEDTGIGKSNNPNIIEEQLKNIGERFDDYEPSGENTKTVTPGNITIDKSQQITTNGAEEGADVLNNKKNTEIGNKFKNYKSSGSNN